MIGLACEPYRHNTYKAGYLLFLDDVLFPTACHILRIATLYHMRGYALHRRKDNRAVPLSGSLFL